MEFLRRVVEEGLPKLALRRHDAFLDALRLSLTVDPEAYQQTLFEPYSFEQRELYDLRVLLLRPLAYEFLSHMDRNLTRHTLDKRTSYQAYIAKYQREPWLISVRPKIMMLTYSEWMDLALGKVLPLQVPKVFDE